MNRTKVLVKYLSFCCGVLSVHVVTLVPIVRVVEYLSFCCGVLSVPVVTLVPIVRVFEYLSFCCGVLSVHVVTLVPIVRVVEHLPHCCMFRCWWWNLGGCHCTLIYFRLATILLIHFMTELFQKDLIESVHFA